MRKMVYEGSNEEIKPTLIWSLICALLRVVVEAEREYKRGRDVRYLPCAVEFIACSLRKQMGSQNERLDRMRNNFVRSDPHYFAALDRLGLSCLREEDELAEAPAPAPWYHDWHEDDFDDDEEENEDEGSGNDDIAAGIGRKELCELLKKQRRGA